MNIPFVDLESQYNNIKSDILSSIEKVLDSKKFIQGPHVEEFEKSFSNWHGNKFSVGCSNGTSAISVSLKILGIGPGDEVITPVNTFFATVEAICDSGATPVFVDCCPETYLMKREEVRKVITSKTKALLPVHLYGNPVNMNAMKRLAAEFDLKIIEDCAQAHLARSNGQPVGTFGEFGTFSFYPGKNLGAYGDAGLITTQDEKLADSAKMYVNHGRKKKYEHDFLGGNYRMDAIQAEILQVKIKYLKEWTEARQKVARTYNETLKENKFKVIEEVNAGSCVYHLFVVEVSNRDEVMEHLEKNGIACGIHYPIPMHLQPALSYLNLKKGDFPIAEQVSERIISLPIFPELSKEQQDHILKSFLEVAKS